MMEQLNASYGLDKPIVLGFVTWAGDALKGNFGDSWKYTVPVLDKFKEVIWLSFVMGAISFILQLIIAIPLGVVAATKQYSKADYLITAGALMGISLPTFFFATLLKLLFSVKLGWFDLYVWWDVIMHSWIPGGSLWIRQTIWYCRSLHW